MMNLEILYNRGSKGEIRYHSIKVVHAMFTSQIIMKHGVLGGAEVKSTRDVTSGKNLGKSNATTVAEQAEADAKSMFRSKKDEGYKSLKELGITQNGMYYYFEHQKYPSFTLVLDKALPQYNTDAAGRVKPMLLNHLYLEAYGRKKKSKERRITYPCYIQPKKDGVCAVAGKKQTLTTRGGKERMVKGGAKWSHLCKQITDAIQALPSKYNDVLFHGEVWKQGHTLEEIQKACKKQGYPLSRNLEFWIFDVVMPNKKQNERIAFLTELEDDIEKHKLDTYLKIMPTTMVPHEKRLLEYEDVYLANGDEGLVARNTNGKYIPDSRSNDVLKLVRFDSMEVKVVDVVPMDNAPDMGKFVCEYDCGVKHGGVRQFFVTPGKGFDHDTRKWLLKNKQVVINQMLTIDHRGFTNKGLPRIATGKAFREKNS